MLEGGLVRLLLESEGASKKEASKPNPCWVHAGPVRMEAASVLLPAMPPAQQAGEGLPEGAAAGMRRLMSFTC